ncbi:MAG: PEGA domain-containing protein [Minicystis sp.]
MRASLLVAALALLTASCVPAAPPTTSLKVKGKVPDASVTVDDQYLGALAYVAAHGVALPPGKHRVTVEKIGYFPWDRLLNVNEGDPPISLDVTLTRVPD